LPQSSSFSRFTAGASAFFILSQSGERPEDQEEFLPVRDDTFSPMDACAAALAKIVLSWA
jgi:hypothetical protein